jgi:hypothetical protein
LCGENGGVDETSGNATAFFALNYSIAYPLATMGSTRRDHHSCGTIVSVLFAAADGTAVVRPTLQQKTLSGLI